METVLRSGTMPERGARDAAHLAIATVHGMDYVLTWNCRHMANARILKGVSDVCARAGYKMPIVCTPEELMAENWLEDELR